MIACMCVAINQFVLNYSNKNAGLGVRRGKLYMLSLDDYILHLSDVSTVDKKWKGTNISSKLWYRRSGRISRGEWKDLLKMRYSFH
jgi:hypothetical protein